MAVTDHRHGGSHLSDAGCWGGVVGVRMVNSLVDWLSSNSCVISILMPHTVGGWGVTFLLGCGCVLGGYISVGVWFRVAGGKFQLEVLLVVGS